MNAIPADFAADSPERRVPAPKGPIHPGTDAHKTLFCRTLLDTFNPDKPAVIDWPVLDVEARDRLISLPIWDVAVQTEGRARLIARLARRFMRWPRTRPRDFRAKPTA